MRVRNASILAVLPLVVVIGASCGGNSDADLVEAAFLEFQTGLAEAKGDVLWGIVDDSTRTYFEELAKSIRETCRLVSEAYPSDDRAATLRSVGGDILASARDGKSLFVYMLDARRLVPPKDPDSAKVLEIKLNGRDATVVTRSGEVVAFARNADGKWGTRMFLEAFRELPAIATLKDNIRTAHENCRMLGIDVDAYVTGK